MRSPTESTGNGRRRSSSSSSSASSSSEEAGSRPLDLTADDGWEEAEPDVEKIEVVSLFDNTMFAGVDLMLEHCKKSFSFDLVDIVRRLELDFYACIKLVNYIRSEVKQGNLRPSTEAIQVFEDDKYLKPVLEDDALLFSVDEILELAQRESDAANGVIPKTGDQSAEVSRIYELEEQLQQLQSQFADYRAAVEKTLDERWGERGADGSSLSSSALGARAPTSISDRQRPPELRDDDTHYFDSYAYNDIHEIMLKDTVRTSAYRDFIYTHKPLFANKTVLDIGCGTGILSMFSAKAGAAKVFAVDNSDIIAKARENVAQNGLLDTIHCIRGKVEEVELPAHHHPTKAPEDGTPPGPADNAGKVDIIVSEWMGYCLLYESMLDSVLHARDRLLHPTTGLMVPSHCTLHIAPVASPDYVADAIGFWRDVYGFDMAPMCEKIHEDVVVRSFPASAMPAASAVFKTLPLHTVRVEELVFEGAGFEVVLERDVEALDGWAVWFDAFFLPGREVGLPEGARAEEWPKDDDAKGVAFTTGPGGPETHWRAGLLTIDHARQGKGKRRGLPVGLSKGQRISGTVGYKKREGNSRELVIEVRWVAEGTEEKGEQVWLMR